MMLEERFPGSHFPKCIVLQAIFWYLRYGLSYRDIEELVQETRDKGSQRFLAKAISNNEIPEKTTIDGSVANNLTEIFYSLAA